MAFSETRSRVERSAPANWLLLIVLLPALLFGPMLGGAPVWVHSHGQSGGHLHVLPSDSVHVDLGALDAWHDAHHRHGDEIGAPEEEEHAPEGLLIELPQLLASASRLASPLLEPALQAFVPIPSLRWPAAFVEDQHRPERCRSGWPPQKRARTGIAALLRSSHAILI